MQHTKKNYIKRMKNVLSKVIIIVQNLNSSNIFGQKSYVTFWNPNIYWFTRY